MRVGLVTDVAVRRQPICQAGRCLPGRGQGGEEVGQARPQGRDGLASQSTLAQQEPGHVPHAQRREIIDADVDQVGQESAGRPVFRDHGRLGVAATAARSEVVVPQRTEPGRTPVLRRDHWAVHVDRPTRQHLRHQQHRPANSLHILVLDRLVQRPQPNAGLVRDEVDAHQLARSVHAPTRQESREPVQHDLILTDRVLIPPRIAHHRHHAVRGVPHTNNIAHRESPFVQKWNGQAILRREGAALSTPGSWPRHPGLCGQRHVKPVGHTAARASRAHNAAVRIMPVMRNSA